MPTTPCILSTLKPAKNGYVHRSGKLRNKWGTCLVHRQEFAEHHGWLPDGLLDHMCHNEDPSCLGGNNCLHRRCCNVKHLVPATQKDNLRRGKGFAGTRHRQTHCIHEHEFTKKNTRIRANGTRQCRKCDLIRQTAKCKQPVVRARKTQLERDRRRARRANASV
jgi:hypothetical protein